MSVASMTTRNRLCPESRVSRGQTEGRFAQWSCRVSIDIFFFLRPRALAALRGEMLFILWTHCVHELTRQRYTEVCTDWDSGWGESGDCSTLFGVRIPGIISSSRAFVVLKSPISTKMDWWICCSLPGTDWIGGKDILWAAIAAQLRRRSSNVNPESRTLERL